MKQPQPTNNSLAPNPSTPQTHRLVALRSAATKRLWLLRLVESPPPLDDECSWDHRWCLVATNFLSSHHTGAVATAVSQVEVQCPNLKIQTVVLIVPDHWIVICRVRSHSSITTFSFQKRVGLRLESVNSYRWLLDWDPVHPLVQRCRFFFCQAQCSHPTCANVSFSKFLRDERGCWLNQHHAHACLAS